jgi:hypothetical protein
MTNEFCAGCGRTFAACACDGEMLSAGREPIREGHPIVVGSASIPWSEGMYPVHGAWVLPGCERTTNATHAYRAAVVMDQMMKAGK